MGQKLYLIDGHALIFKMHYAFVGRPMVNSRGENTSIISVSYTHLRAHET